MKKVIIIIICTVLISTAVLPVMGETTILNRLNKKFENYSQPKAITSGNTKLKWMIAGDALRCLRSYWLHIPPSYNGSESVPLVLVLHGGRGFNFTHPFQYFRSCIMEDYTNFSKKADEEGFIVVYPNAKLLILFGVFVFDYEIFPAWYYWFIDDVGFIRDLIKKIEKTYNINSSRIYITGKSSGAIMSYSIGSFLSDKVAAIAPVAGTIGGNPKGGSFYYIPTPKNPVSVITFHGTNDSNIPYDGSSIFVSVNESISFWVEHNSCNPEPEINISESGRIIKSTYTNGSNHTEVVLYTSIGGGHWWPGSDDDLIQEVSATDLIWEFFEKHPKK